MSRIGRNDDSGDSHPVEAPASQLSGKMETLEQTAVQAAVEELMEQLDTEQHCEVDVSVDGKWCTFEGTVDSQEIRIALFDLVPTYNGKRFIVDRLHVTYETVHSEEMRH